MNRFRGVSAILDHARILLLASDGWVVQHFEVDRHYVVRASAGAGETVTVESSTFPVPIQFHLAGSLAGTWLGASAGYGEFIGFIT